jgi:hypothetical protein
MTEPHAYFPLVSGQIRVFLFKPVRSFHDPLSGTLKTITLKSDIRAHWMHSFEALSYTWGDLTASHPLLCDGRLINIHTNLRDALLRMRHRSFTIPVWADAMCINQSDEEEKLAQIRIMPDVYRNAQKVWVWFGNEVEATGDAIALLSQLTRMAQDLESATIDNERSGSRITWDSTPPSPAVWNALKALLNAPWFYRLWILQEVALAKAVEFLYGSHSIQWDLLHDYFYYIIQLQWIPGLQLPDEIMLINTNAFDARANTQKSSEAEMMRFGDAVFESFFIQALMEQTCSEPKDRVFGILGFLHPESRQSYSIVPEASVEDIYTQFFYALLQANSGLSILSLKASKSGPTVLPSWCPDFHNQERRLCFIANPAFKASRNDAAQARRGSGHYELILSGCKLDQIAAFVPGTWEKVWNEAICSPY